MNKTTLLPPVNESSPKAQLMKYAGSLGLTLNDGMSRREVWELIKGAKSGELVAGQKADQGPFMYFDQEDDSLIAAELRGELVKTLLYHFEGKDPETRQKMDIWGLSAKGVQTACELMGDPRFGRNQSFRVQGEPIIREDENYIMVVVTFGLYQMVRDKKTGAINSYLINTALGSKREPRNKWYWFHRGQPDEKKYKADSRFCFECAISKAQRNARLSLIPVTLQLEIIGRFKKIKGAVQEITEGQQGGNRKLPQAQIAYLESLAARKGLGQQGLHKLVGEVAGLKSVTAMEEAHFMPVKQRLECLPDPELNIPPDVMKGYKYMGWTANQIKNHWLASLAKCGNRTREAVLKQLHRLVDEKEIRS